MKKIAFLILVLFMGAILYAQADGPKPEKYSNVTWHKVSVVDYKPGKTEEAKKIVAKFQSAAAAAGTPTTAPAGTSDGVLPGKARLSTFRRQRSRSSASLAT